jgi:hypothetical protein
MNTDFQKTIEAKLIIFKEEQQFLPCKNNKKKWQYFDISDNLFPPIKHSFLQFAYDNAVPLHDYVTHVRSSQIFAVNLVYPLLIDKDNGHRAILNIFSKIANEQFTRIIDYSFEYSPDKDLLGEWPGDTKPSEYITTVDISVICENTNKDKFIFLNEIKFTENEFGPCNGITSKGCTFENRKNCENFQNVIYDYKKCYLHQKIRQRSARKYFQYFNLRNELIMEQGECPFINNNQCIRNHALARSLKLDGKFKKTYFGLIYYDKNNDIEEEWKKYRFLFKEQSELFSIKASEIVKEYDNNIYKLYFEKRYGL